MRVINDADAASLAEMRWGAGREEAGVVLMLTLGTGTNLPVHWGTPPAQHRARAHRSEAKKPNTVPRMARKREDMAGRGVRRAPRRVPPQDRDLLWPDVIVVGGDKQEVRSSSRTSRLARGWCGRRCSTRRASLGRRWRASRTDPCPGRRVSDQVAFCPSCGLLLIFEHAGASARGNQLDHDRSL